MISLIVYGRNDQHGYNSHRRVAISLNALAEVLTSPDDEILFVDYNTPEGLPTLPEAIDDTLTSKARSRTRVLRVTSQVHDAFLGGQTNHPISEPHARNVAIRRARPGNWILSTNTDMVFVPQAGDSLTDIVAGLDPGAYCLPRFEIPEWLWEGVPRDEPARLISLLDEWGTRAGLAEVTLGHEWIRYDAPGDFQLLDRALIESVCGFDERMIHGWHVDSNLWRRIHNKVGQIGTAYPQVAGYHANHNRTLTRWMNTQSSGNDLTKFVYDVRGWELTNQVDSWGLAGFEIPEISLEARSVVLDLAAASVRIAGQDRPLITSDARDDRNVLAYDARHVLPFLLDPIIGSSPRPSVAYVGINPSTRKMLAKSLESLGTTGELLGDSAAPETAGLVILDLGLDVSTGSEIMGADSAASLARALDSAIERIVLREQPPDFLIINGMSGIWSAWVGERFRIKYGTYHTRVQSAELRDDFTPSRATEALAALVFATRIPEPATLQNVSDTSQQLDFTTAEGIAGLFSGWGGVDEDGAFVASSPAEFRFTTDAQTTDLQHAIVDLTVWTPLGTGRDALMPIRLEIDSEVLLEGPMRTRDRQNSFHRSPLALAPGVHHGTLTIDAAAGYDPFGQGGTQPWVRLERLRMVSSTQAAEWARAAEPGAVLPMGRNQHGEALLSGWWAQSDADGVWALADGGEIVIPRSFAATWVAMEVLGHPERSGQDTLVIARGEGERSTRLASIGAEAPRVVTAALPPPGPDGVVRLSFSPIDAPAPTGELIKVRKMLGAAARSYGLGERIDLRKGSDDLIGLRNGWHMTEVVGTWMSEARAEISVIAGEPMPEGSKVLIEGSCLDPRAQKLRISINGTESRVRRKRGARLIVSVPRAIEEGELITLELAVDPLLSPADRGMSDDPRLLGAVVATLSFST